MAYTHDRSTEPGRLRTLIFDFVYSGTSAVHGINYEFEDADLEAILDEAEADTFDAAAIACRSLAAKFASEAITLGLGKGDISINKQRRSEFYLRLASSYQNRSGANITEYIDSVNYNINVFGSDISEYLGEE